MAQTLSQTQIIRSLGQALEWFEKEMGWGVAPGELGHLTGRIGELYAAMVTRGQMALKTNQRGYDVVSLNGDRISVKTITTSNHVDFRTSTFELVDRVMILRLVIDDDDVSIEELLDCSAGELIGRTTEKDGRYRFSISKEKNQKDGVGGRRIPVDDLRKLRETGSAEFGPHRVVQFENSSILVETNGIVQDMAKPILRTIAKEIGVDVFNGAGNQKNTRTLGADVIKPLLGQMPN